MATDIIKTEMITIEKLISELKTIDPKFEVPCSIVIDEESFMPMMVMTLPMEPR